MSENQGPTPANFLEVLTSFKTEIDSAIMPMIKEVLLGQERITARQNELREQTIKSSFVIETNINALKEEVFREFGEQQGKLRGLLLARMDGLRDEMSQLR